MDGDPDQDQADWFAREGQAKKRLEDGESDGSHASDHDSDVVLSRSPSPRRTGRDGPGDGGMDDNGVLVEQPLCDSRSLLPQEAKDAPALLRDLISRSDAQSVDKSEYPKPTLGIGESEVVRAIRQWYKQVNVPGYGQCYREAVSKFPLARALGLRCAGDVARTLGTYMKSHAHELSQYRYILFNGSFIAGNSTSEVQALANDHIRSCDPSDTPWYTSFWTRAPMLCCRVLACILKTPVHLFQNGRSFFLTCMPDPEDQVVRIHDLSAIRDKTVVGINDPVLGYNAMVNDSHGRPLPLPSAYKHGQLMPGSHFAAFVSRDGAYDGQPSDAIRALEPSLEPRFKDVRVAVNKQRIDQAAVHAREDARVDGSKTVKEKALSKIAAMLAGMPSVVVLGPATTQCVCRQTCGGAHEGACLQRVGGKQRVCNDCKQYASSHPLTTPCACHRTCGGAHDDGACLQRVGGKQRVCTGCKEYASNHPVLSGSALRRGPDDWTLHVLPDDRGDMDQDCRHCGALRFKGEVDKSTMCCRHGKVSLKHLQKPPPAIAALLEVAAPFTAADKSNILNYNEAFQLARMQVYADSEVYPKPGGIPLGRRHDIEGWQPTCWFFGKLERRMVPLEARENKPAGYAQLYFLDPDESLRLRQTYQRACAVDKMGLLLSDIDAHNPYVRDLKVVREQVPIGDQHRILIHANRGAKERCYRSEALYHRGTEVAVLLPDVTAKEAYRSLRVRRNDGQMGWLNDLNRAADPLCYPLLHAHGEDGYQQFDHPDDRDYYADCMAADARERGLSAADIQRARDEVDRLPRTPREYMAYRCMFRRAPDASVANDPGDAYNVLHRGGRLFQRWTCDGGAKMIQQRLAALTSNAFQKNSMRIDTRENIQDRYNAFKARRALEPRAEFQPTGRVHTPNVLPASLPGSNRNQQAAYRDSMAMVRHEGKPYVVSAYLVSISI